MPTLLSCPMGGLHRSSITITEGLNRPWMFAELYSQSPPPGSSLLFSFSEVRQREQTLRQKKNSSGREGRWQCVWMCVRKQMDDRASFSTCISVEYMCAKSITTEQEHSGFKAEDRSQQGFSTSTEVNTDLFPVVAAIYTDVQDWNPWCFWGDGEEI